MTYYCYLDEMQNFCLRASNAFKVIKPENPLLVDFYAAAEEGFFHQKQNCAAVDGLDPALDHIRLLKWEEQAAYTLKEQNDARESKRTTA